MPSRVPGTASCDRVCLILGRGWHPEESLERDEPTGLVVGGKHLAHVPVVPRFVHVPRDVGGRRRVTQDETMLPGVSPQPCSLRSGRDAAGRVATGGAWGDVGGEPGLMFAVPGFGRTKVGCGLP